MHACAVTDPKKPSLPVVGPEAEGLGAPTIMDRALASRHGVRYVHLAVFAIDVDRVRAEAEDEDLDAPFGWEVFLTERYLIDRFDPRRDEDRQLIEDVCISIFERPTEQEPPLGAQITFAVFDAIERGAWPAELAVLFQAWGRKAKKLVSELAPLWQSPGDHARELANACLGMDIDPPLADPTVEALLELTAEG